MTHERNNTSSPHALVAGWFSFEGMGATAGDLIARDVVAKWLKEAEVACDIALAPPFRGGVDWKSVDPRTYTHLVFVCGPFGNGKPVTEMLVRFSGCRLVGLDLSMLQPPAEWNPFDLLIERDSDLAARPDLALLGHKPNMPVVGVVLAHQQKEYGRRARHEQANAAIRGLLDSTPVVPIPIDTRLDRNAGGLNTPEAVECLISRMDAVVTTRLHGLVLAIKHGVAPLAIDPIEGGAKVLRQARALNWPTVLSVEALEPKALEEALDYCLSESGRRRARRCHMEAVQSLGTVRERFLHEIASAAGAP